MKLNKVCFLKLKELEPLNSDSMNNLACTYFRLGVDILALEYLYNLLNLNSCNKTYNKNYAEISNYLKKIANSELSDIDKAQNQEIMNQIDSLLNNEGKEDYVEHRLFITFNKLIKYEICFKPKI